MRPLELVPVKHAPGAFIDEEEEEEMDVEMEDEEGNNFTVRLPDGTHHENVVPPSALTPNASFINNQVRTGKICRNHYFLDVSVLTAGPGECLAVKPATQTPAQRVVSPNSCLDFTMISLPVSKTCLFSV
jgi:hypothetical protein